MKLIVKTLHGVESLLAKELEQLGATNITTQRRAVACDADLNTLYSINLKSRFALRVLVTCVSFKATNDKEIFDNIYNFGWHEIIDPSKSIMIDHITFSSAFTNSQFLAQKAKDAIVDEIRAHRGSRPSVNFENPDILLNIHATDDLITISLDASGTSLNRRGYRSTTLPTATNEVLAAALVELSGWKPSQTLHDPLCGSGTICIEAAMKARNIAANIYRTEPFAFTNWLNFDEKLWNDIVTKAKDEANHMRISIIGSDIDTDSLDVAKLSTLDLGINTEVRTLRRSFRDAERTTEDGMIITCPPVSEEETRRGLDDMYKEITYYFSRRFPDHDAWIYSTNLKALRAIEFRSEKKIEIYNGGQEGNFNLYPF